MVKGVKARLLFNHTNCVVQPVQPQLVSRMLLNLQIFFDESSANPSSPVATPIPVNEHLHPVRHLHDPASHRHVRSVHILENICQVCFQPIHPDEVSSPVPPNNVASSSSPTTSPPALLDDEMSVDSNIPSAQAHPEEKPADIVDEVQAPSSNHLPADNEDLSDLDTSGDLLLQDADLVKLT